MLNIPKMTPLAVDRVDGGVGSPQVQSPNEPTSDSMAEEEKIRNAKVQITQTMDNIIEVGGKARDIGKDTNSKLLKERSAMEGINEDLHKIAQEQRKASYNLKTGFSWSGAFKRKFHKPSKEELESKNEIQPLPTGPHQHCKNDQNLPAEKKKQDDDLKSIYSEDMPAGYDDQLDAIESIVDDLAKQSKELNEEMKSQNLALGAIDHKLVDVSETAEKQNALMRRQFRLR